MVKATDISGSTWHRQELTASGNFTVPNGVEVVYVTGCGAGGGAGGGILSGSTASPNPAQGGSGAGGVNQYPLGVTPGSSLSVNIGAGGVAGNASNAGSNGGNTTVGYLTLEGGKGGNAAVTYSSTPPASPHGGFQTDPTQPGATAPMHFVLGAGTGLRCGRYESNTPVASTQPYSRSGSSGGAGPFGNGGAGGGDTGSTAGASAAANTGAGGGGGASTTSSGYAGGTGGSGYVILEWML